MKQKLTDMFTQEALSYLRDIGDNGHSWYTYIYIFGFIEVKYTVCSKFKSLYNISKCDFDPGMCSGQGQSVKQQQHGHL